jgi:hypothetical protein
MADGKVEQVSRHRENIQTGRAGGGGVNKAKAKSGKETKTDTKVN